MAEIPQTIGEIIDTTASTENIPQDTTQKIRGIIQNTLGENILETPIAELDGENTMIKIGEIAKENMRKFIEATIKKNKQAISKKVPIEPAADAMKNLEIAKELGLEEEFYINTVLQKTIFGVKALTQPEQ